MKGEKPIGLAVAVILVLAGALVLSPQASSGGTQGHPVLYGRPVVYVGYIGVMLDDSSINASRVEELAAESFTYANESGLDPVVKVGEEEYVVFMTALPHYLIVAYNNGSNAVVSVHYAPTPDPVMWWASLDVSSYVNASAIMEKAEGLGWDMLYNSTRTRVKCTTVTVTVTRTNAGGNESWATTTIPPTCYTLTQTHIVLGKGEPRAYIVIDEVAQIENGSVAGVPHLSLIAYVENPGEASVSAVKEFVEEVVGPVAGALEWRPPTGGEYLETMKNVLEEYLKLFADKGVLLTDNGTLNAAINAVPSLSINETVEVSSSGVMGASGIAPPNPYSLTASPVMLPLVTTIITTTCPQPTNTSVTSSQATAPGGGGSAVSGSGNELVGEDVRDAGIALAVAIASAGLVWALLRRGG